MSSTNRGAAVTESRADRADYYATPIPDIVQFLTGFRQDLESGKLKWPVGWTGGWDAPLSVLDPCAGGDERRPMSYPEAIKQAAPGWKVTTLDIREDSLAEYTGDYLQVSERDIAPPDMAITNPPFNLALQIIQHALEHVRPGGLVIMLLRLNFFGSKERSQFFHKQLPVAVYVHPRRMSFSENGKTDSIEYAHFVWQRGQQPDFAMLRVL